MVLKKYFFINPNFKFIFFITLLTSCFSVTSAQKCGQPENVSLVVSKETYNKVMDIIFPHPTPNLAEMNSYFVFRFNPTFKENSQIIFKIYTKGKGGEVIKYKTTDTNVYEKLNEIFNKTCLENPEEMAKLLKVEIKSQKLPNAEAVRLQRQFFANLTKSIPLINQSVARTNATNEVGIILDGTIYELWANFDSNNLFFSFYNNEINKSQITGSLPIIRWMNQVRLLMKK